MCVTAHRESFCILMNIGKRRRQHRRSKRKSGCAMLSQLEREQLLLTDRERVARALDGDQDAFTDLVVDYQRSVYNLTYRMLGDTVEAEDAAQESFLRAYLNLDRYDSQRPLKTWVLSIASHYCIDII